MKRKYLIIGLLCSLCFFEAKGVAAEPEEMKVLNVRLEHLEKDVSKNHNYTQMLTGMVGLITAIGSVLGIRSRKDIRSSFDKELADMKAKFKEDLEFRVDLLEKQHKNKIEDMAKGISVEMLSIQNSNEKLIKKMLRKEEDLGRVKGHSNLLVVSPKNSDRNSSVESVLDRFHSQRVICFYQDIELLDELESHKKEGRLNVVLIENTSAQLTFDKNTSEGQRNIEIAEKLKSSLPDFFIVYIGPRSAGNFPSGDKDYHVSYVNALSKLYSNILDALQYMSILKKYA